MARKQSFLHHESRFSMALSTVWDLMKLNLLTLVCSLPVITIGASFTAMHQVMIKLVRKEESYVSRDYFHALKENFLSATLLWLLKLAFLIPLFFQLISLDQELAVWPKPLSYVVLTSGFAILILLAFVFPLQAYFKNTLLGTIGNSFRLGIAKLPRAVVMAFIWILPVMVLVHLWLLFPVVLFLGISLPGYLCCRLYEPVFRNLTKDEG